MCWMAQEGGKPPLLTHNHCAQHALRGRRQATAMRRNANAQVQVGNRLGLRPTQLHSHTNCQHTHTTHYHTQCIPTADNTRIAHAMLHACMKHTHTHTHLGGTGCLERKECGAACSSTTRHMTALLLLLPAYRLKHIRNTSLVQPLLVATSQSVSCCRSTACSLLPAAASCWCL